MTLYAPQVDQQQDLVPAQTSDALNAGNRVAHNDVVRGIAVAKIELGQAYILSRDIDQAAVILGSVANLVAQNRTDRLTKNLRTTRSSLQPWQDTRAVKALDEKLEEWRAGYRSLTTMMVGAVMPSTQRPSRHSIRMDPPIHTTPGSLLVTGELGRLAIAGVRGWNCLLAAVVSRVSVPHLPLLEVLRVSSSLIDRDHLWAQIVTVRS